MPARYRVALHGFSDFERTGLTFCFKHAASRDPGYVQVERLDASDFIVADASHEPPAGSVTRDERLRDTLFIGEHPPPGAKAHLRRPINPERILRALDQMAAQRHRRPRETQPDIAPPMNAADSRFPVLDTTDVVDTTPAAFQHEPMSVTFIDLESLDAADSAALSLDAADTEATPLPAPVPPPEPARPARATEAERAEAKAAARRASRRARQAQAADAAANAPRDVLLLDPAAGPVALEFLLEAFGFAVHRADGIAAAMAVLERTPLAAAFLDVAAHDGSGIDGLTLCHRIKHRMVPLAGAVPGVMLMSGRDSAAERVRGKLAGCDAFLTRPVRRGDAARALESCDIALPADARRT